MINILFIFTIIGFSLGQIARIQLPSNTAVTMLDIAVFFLVASWLITKLLKRESIKSTLLRPIGIFILACLGSLAINSLVLDANELFIAFLYLLRWVFYAGVYFVICDQNQNVREKMPLYLIFGGCAHLLIGYTQYFFFPDLGILFHLGWDEHLYRMFGSLLDPNFLGAIFVLLFNLVIYYLFDQKDKLHRNKVAGLVVISILILLAIVLTYSRSALVMLLFSIITLSYLKGSRRLGYLIVGVVCIFVVAFSNVAIEGLNPFRTVSSGARIQSMDEALHIIKKNSIFGVGFNAYRYAQQRYGLRVDKPPIVSHADAGTDNSYLFVFATTGIVGLSTYLYLLWSIFSLTIRKRTIVAAVTTISLIGIFANSIFINSLFYPFVLYWLWVIVGLTENS